MASELDALLGILRQGNQAGQTLPGMNTELAEAKALRAQPIAPIDQKTGFMSPFAALAGMIDKGRGAQQQRELKPRIAQAQQQVGNAEMSAKEYTLRKAMKDQETKATNRTADQGREDLHRKAVLKQQLKIAMLPKSTSKSKKSKPEVYVDTDGKKHNISFDNETGMPYAQNEGGEVVQTNISEMTKYDKPTAGTKIGKSVPFKDADGLVTNITFIDGVPNIRTPEGKWEETSIEGQTQITPSQVRQDKPQDYKAYMDKDGNIIQVQREGEKTYRQDAEGNRVPQSMDGLRDVDDVLKGGDITAEKLGNMSAPDRKTFIGADSAIRQMNRLQVMASKLSPEDIEKLESGQQSVGEAALDTVTPGAFSNYIKQNVLGYSPAALEYMRSIQEFSAGIRHDKYGSALTKPEIAFSNLWLAGAPGLTGQQSNDRMRGTVENMIGTVGSVDNLYQTNLTGRLSKLVERKELTDFATPKVAPELQTKIDANNARIADIKKRMAEKKAAREAN